VAIFGRKSTRLLRRATHESLRIPVFSSPIDCTPWVLGGVWPAEFSVISAETAGLAEDLRSDLQRIAADANTELKILSRERGSDSIQRADALRLIDNARVRAVRRVELAVRHLHTVRDERPAGRAETHPAEQPGGLDLDTTQHIPRVTGDGPAVDVRRMSNGAPAATAAVGDDEPEDSAGRHRAAGG
jgi:hypothetical protein